MNKCVHKGVKAYLREEITNEPISNEKRIYSFNVSADIRISDACQCTVRQ